jgi:predicted AAA+ superfamily ATPase
MLDLPDTAVLERLRLENPWWGGDGVGKRFLDLKRRAYFAPFLEDVTAMEPRRAVILMGPRRVGKTVLVQHVIAALRTAGVPAHAILYASLDAPIYNKTALDRLVRLYIENISPDRASGPKFIFFDEIQYVREWERHLKVLVDDYGDLKFIATGSAAAALRLASQESGAGRFSHFTLPPLTFSEYLSLTGTLHAAEQDIRTLNEGFEDYVNFGGYPEVALSGRVQADLEKYVGADIIDKVLLRDLPSLYGIQDVQELNSLFLTLAYNTGQEVSLEALSQRANVAKNTLKRYLEYLEAAFLIRTVERVDRTARRFQRARTFKVYLTNPSMRAALFGPMSSDDDLFGALAETAVFAQWMHAREFDDIRYARWDGDGDGEVDLVYLDRASLKAISCVEVKWSDRYFNRPSDLKGLVHFAQANPQLRAVHATTKTAAGIQRVAGVDIEFTPTARYALDIARRVTRKSEQRRNLSQLSLFDGPPLPG